MSSFSSISFEAPDSFDKLEALVHRDPCRRGVASFLHRGRFLDAGQLESSARHLAEHARSVAIVTGFAVRAEPRPVAETDGPPGALYLARALRAIGVEVTLISDAYGVPLLEVGCKLWGLPTSMLAEFPGDARLAADWIDSFLAGHATLTHLISIERVGPSHTLDSLRAQRRDGHPPIEDFQREVPPEDRDVCHNMRGMPLDDITAPTHLLFDAIAERRLPITTIGIGDGGNEISLGKFPWEVLRQAIASDVGGRIACRIATDFTLLAGVSNWAGYALAGAVCALYGRSNLLTPWTADSQRALIETLVRDAGAIDGLTLRREPTIDGLTLDEYLTVFSQIHACCTSGR